MYKLISKLENNVLNDVFIKKGVNFISRKKISGLLMSSVFQSFLKHKYITLEEINKKEEIKEQTPKVENKQANKANKNKNNKNVNKQANKANKNK